MSDEYIETEILIPSEFAPRGRAFVLRVSGDSMEGVGIFADDFVIVRQAKTANPGNVVAVTVDGESTLKLLHHRHSKWTLIAANPKYAPIEIQSPAVVHGVMTAVMRVIKEGNPQILSWVKLARGWKG